MSRTVGLLGLVTVLAAGAAIVLLATTGGPPIPSAPERPEAPPGPEPERRDVEPGPEAPAVDEDLERLLAVYRDAVTALEDGRPVDALRLLARIRNANPAFLDEPARAKIVARAEDAALSLLLRRFEEGRFLAARGLAEELRGLIGHPGRLDILARKVELVARRLADARRAGARRLLTRAKDDPDVGSLSRHLERFGGTRSRRRRAEDGTDRALSAVAARDAKTAGEPLPLPDPDAAEERRLDQLEKLRRREALGLLDSIAAGLAWLALHQGDDGRITENGAKARCAALGHESCVGKRESKYPLASTALSVLAFLDFRDQDTAGLFEPTLARAVDGLLAQQHADGSFPAVNNYERAIAVMALGQAAASSGRTDLRVAAAHGLAGIAARPGPNGGFRYRPGQPGDLSVTGWVVQAHEAAVLSEASIPSGLRAGLGEFWAAVRLGDGRFAYLAGGTGRRNLDPVGMLTAHILELPEARELRTRWRQKLAGRRSPPSLYGLYYGVRTLLALDERLPESWRGWLLSLASRRIAKGPAAGSFPAEGPWKLGAGGIAVHTAFAVLTLEHALYRR